MVGLNKNDYYTLELYKFIHISDSSHYRNGLFEIYDKKQCKYRLCEEFGTAIRVDTTSCMDINGSFPFGGLGHRWY